MRRRDVRTVALFTVVLVAMAATPALARVCQVGTGSIFDPLVNKFANGTKVSGPVTIHYEDTALGGDCGASDISVGLNILMRLRKGTDLYKFSIFIEKKDDGSPICYNDVNTQWAIFKEFIRLNVIPAIFPATPNAPFDVKSVTQVVDCTPGEPSNPGNPSGPLCEEFSTVFDVEIAVGN